MFDRLHSKKISRPEFIRALSIAGVELSAVEAEELFESYVVPEMPDKIRYLALSDDINRVFTVKLLERTAPMSPVSVTPVPRQPAMIGNDSFEGEVEANVARDRVRYQVIPSSQVDLNYHSRVLSNRSRTVGSVPSSPASLSQRVGRSRPEAPLPPFLE